MKAFLIATLVATLSFSATVDDFLESLKQEVLKYLPYWYWFVVEKKVS